MKLKLKQLGHIKCSYDRKAHKKEWKWLNHVMGQNSFKNEKMYRVCSNFIRHHTSSIDHGKSKSTLRIQNNQPYSVGLVKVSMDGEETQTISPRSSECSQEGEINSLFHELLKIRNLGKSSWIYPKGGGEIEFS